MIKMYCVFTRSALRVMKYEGKLAAQAGHAFLHAWWDAENRLRYEPKKFAHWDNDILTDYWINIAKPFQTSMDARKIVKVVDNESQLREMFTVYKPFMGATLVEDAAYTVFDKPTITCIGLGPINDEFIENTPLKKAQLLKKEL